MRRCSAGQPSRIVKCPGNGQCGSPSFARVRLPRTPALFPFPVFADRPSAVEMRTPPRRHPGISRIEILFGLEFCCFARSVPAIFMLARDNCASIVQRKMLWDTGKERISRQLCGYGVFWLPLSPDAIAKPAENALRKIRSRAIDTDIRRNRVRGVPACFANAGPIA